MKILIKWSVSKEFLGIIGPNPSVSKSNQLHVGIFSFFFIDLRHILYIPLTWLVIFFEVLNFNRLFLKLNWFILKVIT